MTVIAVVTGRNTCAKIRVTAVFQQIICIQSFGNHRTIGLTDTRRSATCTFLHRNDFYQSRIQHMAALVVVDLAVRITIVHFHIY